MRAIGFLICSNIFMTFAWYGHLKWFGEKDSTALWKLVLISWGIAFFEYCFQVPGNRLGRDLDGFSTGQLKIIQEIITLTVFAVFAAVVLKEDLGWRYFGAVACLAGAAGFMFAGKV